MNLVLFICLAVIFGPLESSDVEKHCSNEFCPEKTPGKHNESEKLSLESPTEEIIEEVHIASSTDALNEKEIYVVHQSEQKSESAANKSFYKLEINTTAPPEETSSESVFSSTDYLNIVSEETVNATVGTLKSTEIGFENVPNKSVSISNTTTTEMMVMKSVPTTQVPPPMSNLLVKQTFKKGNICFCDLKVNECDINCCCDLDCIQSHYKVFTKCMNDNFFYDEKYCYKNYFIFANNTSHKIVQKNGGLFCIARENIQLSSNYESKPVLTTLEAFNKNLPNDWYAFSFKTHAKSEFKTKDYSAGSPVWTVQNGELKPFRVHYSSVGHLCNSEMKIKYLVDQVTTCFIQLSNNECEGKKIRDMLHGLRNMKIISKPGFINATQKSNSSKICEGNECIKITLYMCQAFDDGSECLQVKEDSREFLDIGCWNVLSSIDYQILHNGSEGILKVEAHLWARKLAKNLNEFFSPFITDVQFKWVGSAKQVFKRSGNPGYLTGKPVLAGRKIYINETSGKKEAMEVSANPNEWLNVLGSKKGICSFSDRIPINFRENGQFMCSLQLRKDNFTKEKCLELQNNIYKLLIGQDTVNFTKENYFNKFVATFGNSRVEETGDWVQVLIDLFPLSSSQTSFKSNHNRVMCKNIVTDLYVDIVYSYIGSVLAPQAKILGVSFHFGKHKDLTYHCDSPGCENTSLVQYFKLSTSVRFVDVTKPAIDAFAEPLYLETKLPHDFFYPFFSRGYRCQALSKLVFIVVLSVFF